MPHRLPLLVLVLAVLAVLTCAGSAPHVQTPRPRSIAPDLPRDTAMDLLPGMPPLADPDNVYADAGAGMLSAVVREDRPLVYVPHTVSGDVWVIDPATFTVIARYPAGREPQHIVPSYDMRTLYATDDRGHHLLSFDARTGLPGRRIPVIDPYNMYFTPDGQYAIAVAEARRELIWYDPHSWVQRDVTPTPTCAGIDHGDFSADGRTAVFSCEFAGAIAVVDVVSHHLLRGIPMPVRHTHMGPQDVKLAPDSSAYYVADCDAGGLWVLDGAATTVRRFIPTGRCAHGLYLSRDAKRLFVTNRGEGSISVLDADTGAPITKWHIPGGGSPDMGNLTADGTQFWISGRYDNVVYVLSTVDGALIKKIPVGKGPHGLSVWPQPGRYSLGHTGITR
jgi:YVTN family beta-propeller protein